jgi:AcrR family transcriptional regulator
MVLVMTAVVKGSSKLREARKADTEQRILGAATRLFLANGYAGTSLAAVAEEAEVGDRTVYVRFGTKAELLKRVIDVAVVGDTENIALAERDWVIRSMTAPTLEERIEVLTNGTAELMERVGPLMAVAGEAEPTEAVIADAGAAARNATLDSVRAFWEAARADGLLQPDVDVEWVIATSSLLGAPETYLLMTRTLRWDLGAYRDWRYRTWLHLAKTPTSS